MRILLCNTGYLLGRRDWLGGYFPSPREAFFGDAQAEERATVRLLDVLRDEHPDVICLVEVDNGSFRTATEGQMREVRERLAALGLPYTARVFGKYGPHNLVGQLPFFRHLANGVLLAENYPTNPRYLTTGTKRLVIETHLPGVTLLVAHLSVKAGTRRQQLGELAGLLATEYSEDQVLLAGDFNTYQGVDELTSFIKRTGLRPVIPGATIPERPLDEFLLSTRAIDFFLASPAIMVEHARVIDSVVSDHRPILLTITT